MRTNRNELFLGPEQITRSPIHPGIIFGEEVLPELTRPPARRTVGEISKMLGTSRQTLFRLTRGEIAMSAEMAARIGKLTGMGARIWLSIQADYDAFATTKRMHRELKRIPTLA